jgi:hypothetical protein
MITVCERSQVAIQAGLPAYDHVIQALPPNGADQPLHMALKLFPFLLLRSDASCTVS